MTWSTRSRRSSEDRLLKKSFGNPRSSIVCWRTLFRPRSPPLIPPRAISFWMASFANCLRLSMTACDGTMYEGPVAFPVGLSAGLRRIFDQLRREIGPRVLMHDTTKRMLALTAANQCWVRERLGGIQGRTLGINRMHNGE